MVGWYGAISRRGPDTLGSRQLLFGMFLFDANAQFGR
jgi:hypothetical protein